MPKIPCPAGRTIIRGGKSTPVWHKKDGSDCPVCSKNSPALQPATETAAIPGSGGKPPTGPATSSAATEGGRDKTGGATPHDGQKKPGLMRRLGFGSNETSPELPIAPPKNKPPEYFVDAKHTIEFGNLCYGGLRWVCDLLDKLLMTEEAGGKRFTREHPELLTLSDFEKEGITLDPKSDLWGRAATGLTRLVGCKTQEQAHSAIDTLSFFGHFGMLIGFFIDHYWHAWRDGKPARKAKQEAKKAAIASRRAEVKLNGRDSQGQGRDMEKVGFPTVAAPA